MERGDEVDGDVADVRTESAEVLDRGGMGVDRKIVLSELSVDAVERGEYRHYMLKEIFEQPHVLAATLEGRVSAGRVLEGAFGPGASKAFENVEAVQIAACGTSYHAGLIARQWFEEIAG